MRGSEQRHDSLEVAYRRRYKAVLVRLADALRDHIADLMEGQPRIDRITARAKSVSRFLRKAAVPADCGLKYSDPLVQIQDQVGARIVVFYQCDVERIEKEIGRYFSAIENRKLIPESESEFGYFGHHLVLVIPTDVVAEDMEASMVPGFFELQIKTLFQHAWSEADHDLGYKPDGAGLSSDQKRRIAFTSAQAWGADQIFEELYKETDLGAM